MFQTQHVSTFSRPLTNLRLLVAGAACLALTALLGSSPAQAHGIRWSVGINAPGVVVGVGNGHRGYAPPPRYYSAPAGYYAPPPVYYTPPPAYYQPPPAYYAPAPRPIYYAPPVFVPGPAHRPYYGPGWRGQRHGERHHGYGYRD